MLGQLFCEGRVAVRNVLSALPFNLGAGDGGVEQRAEHPLHLRRSTEEEARGGGEQLEPHRLRLLLREGLDQRLEQVGRFGDDVAVLGHHPQQRHLRVRTSSIYTS